MSDILTIIVLVVVTLISLLIIIYQVMVPRGNPSKLLSDILKIKREENESNDNVKIDGPILRWRVIAGILTGLVMLYILRPSWWLEFGPIYPWIYHIFWPLLFLTIIVFIILLIKERKHRFNKE